MFYYKDNQGSYVTSTTILNGLEEITKEEYDEAFIIPEPTEEEIRAAKEAEVARLLRELYPDEYKEG